MRKVLPYIVPSVSWQVGNWTDKMKMKSTSSSPISIEKRIYEIVHDVSGLNPVEMHGEGNLSYDYGMDSLDMVELIMTCEKVFGIIILDEETQDIITLADFSKLIQTKMAA